MFIVCLFTKFDDIVRYHMEDRKMVNFLFVQITMYIKIANVKISLNVRSFNVFGKVGVNIRGVVNQFIIAPPVMAPPIKIK